MMAKLATSAPASLEGVHRFMLQLELAQLGEELEDGYEVLRSNGQLAPELIDQAICKHREKHPYSL
jgi:hypothetical protein